MSKIVELTKKEACLVNGGDKNNTTSASSLHCGEQCMEVCHGGVLSVRKDGEKHKTSAASSAATIFLYGMMGITAIAGYLIGARIRKAQTPTSGI